MLIALDLDGVCVDLHGSWPYMYNEWFDATVSPDDVKTWEAPTLLTHFEKDRDFFHWADTQHPTFWEDLAVVPGFQQGVVRLSQAGHKIMLVTNRLTVCQRGTEAWLRRHWPLGIPTPSVHFVADSKSVIEAQVYVDDSPTVISDLMGRSKQVIKFKRPWNREAVSTATAADWDELTKLLLSFGEAIAA